ncbi:hypothetical protein [Embleya sp. NBC_00896]|uniref:hypothetical protein n=1 Tax=Embleya sp. NBC_00896 TaxID=2975961 RepID=UPI00386C917B|nr:hypothetical protein OG928_22585 [Embleya sp. NBC_00896]
MVRFTADEAHVADIEKAIEAMHAAIRRARPTGARYASCKLADGVTFVNMLELAEGVENPLRGIPECLEFQRRLPNWLAEPPAPETVTVLGSYRLFA